MLITASLILPESLTDVIVATLGYTVILIYAGIIVFALIIVPILEFVSDYWSRLDCPKCSKRKVGVVANELNSSINKFISTTTCKKCGHIIKTEEQDWPLPEPKKSKKRNRSRSYSKSYYSRSSSPGKTITATNIQPVNPSEQVPALQAGENPVVNNENKNKSLGDHSNSSSNNGDVKSVLPPPVIKNSINQQPILMNDLVDKNNAWIDGEVETIARQALPETKVVLLHKQIQRELTYCLLRTDEPGRFVYNEFRCIDILVEDTSCFTLIEIKTSLCAMTNIRDAIGQLLEYQFMSRLELIGKRNSLLIVSPALLTHEACDYVNHLGSLYNIAIAYKHYVPGSFLFAL